jgi:hypothetical protein
MPSTDLRKRFDELIERGKKLPSEFDNPDIIDFSHIDKWAAQCQVALEKAFGRDSVYFASFKNALKKEEGLQVIFGLPIMEAAREELDREISSDKLGKIKEQIGKEKAEAERRAAVVETKQWGSVIEVIDMLREELQRRNQLSQDMIGIHGEVEDIKSILTEMKNDLRLVSEQESMELKDRIRGELELILQDVTSDCEKEAFQSRAFFTEGFIALKEDLIRKLDAKTFRTVLETYIKIDQLRFPLNDKDLNRAKYKEAVAAIQKTIELLK